MICIRPIITKIVDMNHRNVNPDLEDVYSSIEDSVDEYYASIDYQDDSPDCGKSVWVSEEFLEYSLRGVSSIRV